MKASVLNSNMTVLINAVNYNNFIVVNDNNITQLQELQFYTAFVHNGNDCVANVN